LSAAFVSAARPSGRRLLPLCFNQKDIVDMNREPPSPDALPTGPDDGPALITPQELARLLAVSVRTLWRLRSTRRLPVEIRLGGSVRWRRTEILAWIAAGCPDREAWIKRGAR
jgi:excisionase family DNA binding protein